MKPRGLGVWDRFCNSCFQHANENASAIPNERSMRFPVERQLPALKLPDRQAHLPGENRGVHVYNPRIFLRAVASVCARAGLESRT